MSKSCFLLLLLLFILPSLTTSAPTEKRSKKSSKCTSLDDLHDKSFLNHVQLIQYGIPSFLVSFFFSSAINALGAPDCVCATNPSITLKNSCIKKHFKGKNTLLLKTLKPLIKKPTLFPAYNRNKKLALPNNLVELEKIPLVVTAQEKTLANARDFFLGEKKQFAPRFPTDEEMFWDPEREPLCAKYRLESFTVTATTFWAYVIGLGFQVRFRLEDGATLAREFVNSMAAEVWFHVRCQRKQGKDLLLPYSILARKAELGASSLLEKHTSIRNDLVLNLPHVADIEMNAAYSTNYYREYLPRLSSFVADRLPVVLVTDGHTVHLKNIVDKMLEVTLEDYVQYVNGIGAVPPGSSFGGRGPELCSDGYIWIHRLIPIVNPFQCCCPDKCAQGFGSNYGAADMEICCFECNEYRCGGDTTPRIGDPVQYDQVMSADSQTIFI